MINNRLFWNRLFQIGSLQKSEKENFISLMESNFRTHGFEKVNREFDGQKKYSMALRFERIRNKELGEWIEVVFDKYGARRFYINLGVTELLHGHNHVKLGALVRSQKQYQYWWGAKWYSLFRKRVWLKDITQVQNYIPQMVSFLREGSVGNNIKDLSIEVD